MGDGKERKGENAPGKELRFSGVLTDEEGGFPLPWAGDSSIDPDGVTSRVYVRRLQVLTELVPACLLFLITGMFDPRAITTSVPYTLVSAPSPVR